MNCKEIGVDAMNLTQGREREREREREKNMHRKSLLNYKAIEYYSKWIAESKDFLKHLGSVISMIRWSCCD